MREVFKYYVCKIIINKNQEYIFSLLDPRFCAFVKHVSPDWGY